MRSARTWWAVHPSKLASFSPAKSSAGLAWPRRRTSMKTETKQPARAVGRRRALTASLLTGVVGLGSSVRAEEQTPKSRLRMATSWPTSLPLLHESAMDFAHTVEALTDGRLVIEVDDPGKHGKPVGILDLVRSGDYDLGHTTA